MKLGSKMGNLASFFWDDKNGNNVGNKTGEKSRKNYNQNPNQANQRRINIKILTDSPANPCKYFVFLRPIKSFDYHNPPYYNPLKQIWRGAVIETFSLML